MRYLKRDGALMPCPFCGNKYVRMITGIKVGTKHHMVACDRCEAIVHFEDASLYTSCEKKWNRRAGE